MRSFISLAKVSARETLEEALSPVLFLFAYFSVHLLPVFHYHRFGEVARLERECAMSAMLVCGTWFSAAAALKIISREISSGTAAAAIACGTSRAGFFIAKTAGTWFSLLLFSAGTFFAGALSCATSLAGAALFEEGAQETSTWGPGLALGVSFTLGAFILAAALNRFKRSPFASTACKLLAVSQILAFCAASIFVEGAWILAATLLAPWLALTLATTVFATIGAAAAVWLAPAAAATITVVAVASALAYPVTALVPSMQMFWLSDAVPDGGPAAENVLRAAGACIALSAMYLIIGVAGINRKDIS